MGLNLSQLWVWVAGVLIGLDSCGHLCSFCGDLLTLICIGIVSYSRWWVDSYGIGTRCNLAKMLLDTWWDLLQQEWAVRSTCFWNSLCANVQLMRKRSKNQGAPLHISLNTGGHTTKLHLFSGLQKEVLQNLDPGKKGILDSYQLLSSELLRYSYSQDWKHCGNTRSQSSLAQRHLM